MKLTPELYFLALVATATVLMWIPYMSARILTRGAARTLANPADPASPPDPAWAERARRAHANAVENLAVFAPLVHYIVYAAGIPVIRTLAFVVGFGATLVIAAAVLSHV